MKAEVICVLLSTGVLLALNGLFVMLRVAAPGSFPRPLAAAEEKKLLEQMSSGSAAARDKLIEHNLRLVAHIMKKYYAQGADQDDLISIGTIGLIKGISSFDVSKGARLSTYAARCIENEILMYFRSKRKQSMEVSLSEVIEGDQEGNSLSLMDVISVDDTMLDDISTAQTGKLVRSYVNTQLDEREKMIICLRYGLDGKIPLTQRETAQKCGISRSYVSRIEKKALQKLKTALQKEQ
ncbi:MAG: RNA polymerase sporulation sigma factor SigK [Oscillospiraceae bacterium]|nr:RNA polymerase sporulation sigma factor SigK [Oscillospiraceae bacterium]